MSPGSPSFRLGPSMRLRHRRDFEQIRATGRRLAKGCLIANWVERSEQPELRLRAGFVTSRKVGKAHERNRARRRMRESLRLHQHELGRPIDLVLVARPSIREKPFRAVEADLVELLKQACLIKRSR